MTQFRDGFMTKSPLTKHGEKLRQEAKKLSGNVEQGDYDYENPKVTEKLEAAKKADKSHESDSPASMSPLNGAYESGAGGMVYASERDSIQNMFSTITNATNKLVDSKKSKEKDSFKKVGKRVGDIADKGVDYKFGETLNAGLNLNDKENAFQKYLKS